MTTELSRGARLCHYLIRRARVRKGGLRRCGRPYLARRLGCSTRTVSRYVRELVEAGALDVVPPRRSWTPNGWRTIEVNGYRPHLPRSARHDKPVTPPPDGACAPASQAAPNLPQPHETDQSDGPVGPTPEYLAWRAAHRARRAANWRHRT